MSRWACSCRVGSIRARCWQPPRGSGRPNNSRPSRLASRSQASTNSNSPASSPSVLARTITNRFLSLSDARSLLPDVLGRLDEPLADASILPTYLLSRFTRQSITVALSGDGGDELFAGYDPFKALGPAQLYQRLVPCALHKGLRSLAELLPKSRSNMSFDFKVRRVLSGLGHMPAYWNPVWLAPADPAMIAEIFYAPVCADELYQEAVELWTASTGDVVDRTLEFYTNFYLPDDILAKVDRATMMVSLESRWSFSIQN